MAAQLFFYTLVSGVFTGILFAGIAVMLALSNLADRSLHIASGMIITLLAYVWLWVFQADLGLLAAVVILLAVALAANLGCLVIYRWLDRCGVSSEGIVVGSFGLLITGNSILELIWGTEAYSLRAPWLRGWLSVTGMRVSYADLFMAISLLLLLGALGLILRRGTLSLRLRAVFEDAREAAVAGVNIGLVQTIAYGFGALALTVIALSLGGRSSVTPHMGLFPLLIGIAVLVTAGLGNLKGTFWVGMGMGIIWDMVGVFLGAIWQFAIVFGIPAIVLLTIPEGLFSREGQARRRSAQTHTSAEAQTAEVPERAGVAQ
jgi:branched-subunit amino acid ABC-type transport system permease component